MTGNTNGSATAAPEVVESHNRIDRRALDDHCARLGAYTVVQQAALMGVNKTTLNRWIAGSHIPSIKKADEVCARLGMSRDVLFPATPGLRRVRSVNEVAEEIVAGWPAWDDEQREVVRNVVAVVTRGEGTSIPTQTRRYAA